MSSIGSIPTSRVSDAFVRQQLLNQLEADQSGLTKLQTELSTGNRLTLPSDDPNAAMRGIATNSLVQQNNQIQTNLSLTQSYLNATGSALSDAFTLLTNVRSTALGAIGTSATDTTVSTAEDTVSQAIQQMMQIANQQFNGRYLFSGSQTGTAAFVTQGDNILYQGNDQAVETYQSPTSLIQSNISGSEAFGALSQPVGGLDLNPVLTDATPLADLAGGQGIQAGSIAVSTSTGTSIIDLSQAATIGDVARTIEMNPPSGSTLSVNVTSTGLNITVAGGGTLSVGEVGNGTTAAQLGLLGTSNTGTITGGDLNPRLDLTTPLTNILGSQAQATLTSVGLNNDLIIQANQNGAQYNGATINLVNSSRLQAGPGLAAGNEQAHYSAVATPATASLALAGASNDLILTATTPGTQYNGVSINITTQAGLGNSATASYDATNKVLTLTVDSTGQTSTQALISAIDTQGTFTAARDPSAETNVSGGFILPSSAGAGVSNTYNTGGDANTLTVDIDAGFSSANDVMAAINAEGTFSARLDPSELQNNGSGVLLDTWTNPSATATTSGGSGTVLDQGSGFQITNGGKTYDIDISGAKTVQDLLNTINDSGASVVASIDPQSNGIVVRSALSGASFSIGENGGTAATQLGIRTLSTSTSLASLNNGAGVNLATTGSDLVITRKDGVQLQVSLAGAQTVGDVINDINNANPGGGVPVVASLSANGNGIQLTDDDPSSSGTLSVTAGSSGSAARDLGFLSPTSNTSAAPTPAVSATASLQFPGSNNDLLLTATPAGAGFNGTQVVFENSGAGPSVSYDSASKTLTFDVDPSTTTASGLIALVNGTPAVSANFSLSLAPSDAGNDGSGQLGTLPASTTLSGGAGETFTGADVSRSGVPGVFTALVDLQTALSNNDTSGIQTAINELDQATSTVSAAEAEVGVRVQGISDLTTQLQNQQVNLQSAASTDLDADMTQVISDLLGKQTAFQASLEATGMISQLTLLNYL